MSDILQPGMHPDADQLSTFAEGGASAHEREAMLAHLAECAQCRRVVFLMQGQEATHVRTVEAAKRWTWRWMMPLGLAGAALACGLTAVVYVRTHHAAREIATNNAPVQATVPPSQQLPAPTRREEAPPRPKKGEQAPASVAAAPAAAKPSRPSAGAAGTMAQAPAPVANADGTVILALKTENAPAAPAVPAPAASPMAERAEKQRFAAAKPLPALRIEHDRGPEDGTSQVSGLVTDQTGAVVKGATVTLRNQTGTTRQTASSADGSFNLAEVPPGQYQLKVTAQGFETYQQAMELKPRDMAMLDTKLTVGAEAETVTVEAEAPALNTDSNVISSISSEQISKAPTQNRNFAALAGMQPGVAELPSHQPTAMTVILGKHVLSLDKAGTLFASHDGGKKWKQVKPRWTGKVARIESANSEEFDKQLKKKASAENAPGVFQLTTEDGAVWVSEDGTHWRAR